MPKRIPTPPPSEDEPRYLVVVHPYPLNANLLLHGHRLELALWLACCTGRDALYAMYHKPSSPGMVIIEVDRYFDRFDSLLGKHSWSAFLKNPTEEDKDKASKIFWCIYNSGRLVQKNGWKRVDVEEHWFQGWSPSNNVIKHPYPKSTHCDVPSEAQTGVPLCRPLPKATFPTPAPKPRPPVGTPEWVNARSTNVSSDVPSSSRKRRGNQPAPSSVISSTTAGSSEGARAPPPAQSPVTAWVADQRAKQSTWSRPASDLSFTTLSPSSTSSSIGSRTPSTWGAPPPPARPPGLTRPPSSTSGQSVPQFRSYERFDWSDEVEHRFEADQDDVQTTARAASVSVSRDPGGHTTPPRRIPNPEGAIDPDQDYEYNEEDVPKRSTADAMKDMFVSDPSAASVGNNAGLQDVEEEEEDYLAWTYPEAVSTTTRDWTPDGGEAGGNTDNPWDGYDEPRMEDPTKINIKGGEEWSCPEHGPMCNPGICKLRARLESERRRQKEVKDREEAKKKRLEKWKKQAEKKERKLARAEGREVSSYDPPPHLASYRYRGAGSGSGSGSGSESEDDGSKDSGSLAGSDSSSSPSPPPSPPPEGVAGPEDLGEQRSLWDGEDETPPRVSLPSGSAWSVAGPNRVDGDVDVHAARSIGGARTTGTTNNNNNSKKNNGNNISRGTAAASRQQPTRSAATSVSARSTAAPSARGDVTVPAGAQASALERPPLVRPEDARRAASVRSAATSVRGDDVPATPQSPAPRQRQSGWDTRSAASARTTTTSAEAQSPAPEQYQSAWDTRSTASVRTTTTSAEAQSPAPEQYQSAWDTRSTASARTATSSIRNDRSTEPDSDVAPVPRSGQQNGRQRDRGRSGSAGAASSTRSTGGPAAIVATQSPPISAGPRSPASVSRTPPGTFVPREGGFPTFAGTAWGDPIAAAQSSTRKSKSKSSTSTSAASRSAGGADTGGSQVGEDSRRDNAEAGQGQQQENAGTGRGRRSRGGRRGMAARARAAAATARASESVALPSEPDVTPPPGGPGDSWCDENVEW